MEAHQPARHLQRQPELDAGALLIGKAEPARQSAISDRWDRDRERRRLGSDAERTEEREVLVNRDPHRGTRARTDRGHTVAREDVCARRRRQLERLCGMP